MKILAHRIKRELNVGESTQCAVYEDELKRCTMLWTKCFGSDWKQPSVFLDWIQSKRYESFSVDKNYWDRQK